MSGHLGRWATDADSHGDRGLCRRRTGRSSVRAADFAPDQGPLLSRHQPSGISGMAPGISSHHSPRHRHSGRRVHRARRDPDRGYGTHLAVCDSIQGHCLSQPSPSRAHGQDSHEAGAREMSLVRGVRPAARLLNQPARRARWGTGHGRPCPAPAFQRGHGGRAHRNRGSSRPAFWSRSGPGRCARGPNQRNRPQAARGHVDVRCTAPAATGRGVAGVIDEIGEGVTDVAVGDRVFGSPTTARAEPSWPC